MLKDKGERQSFSQLTITLTTTMHIGTLSPSRTKPSADVKMARVVKLRMTKLLNMFNVGICASNK